MPARATNIMYMYELQSISSIEGPYKERTWGSIPGLVHGSQYSPSLKSMSLGLPKILTAAHMQKENN